jgi:TM2 domain-containing membrane protein YozV
MQYAPPQQAYAPMPMQYAPPPQTVVQVVVQQPMQMGPAYAPGYQQGYLPGYPQGYAQGYPLARVPARPIVRVGNANRLIFAMVAFLLGWFGAHKFYQGKPGWGLLYLLTSWTGIPAIVSWIEGLIAIFQSDAAFDAENNLRSV